MSEIDREDWLEYTAEELEELELKAAIGDLLRAKYGKQN
jgi:hypothetical protein